MRKATFILMIFAAASMVVLNALPAHAVKGIDAGKKIIRVAVVGPMTGNYGAYGKDQKEGMDLYIKEFNASGGIKKGKLQGYKLEAVYFDDKGDPKESTNVAQQVVIGDYFASLGPVNSSAASASAPIYDRNKMAMILIYAADYRLTHSGYKNVFMMLHNTEGQGRIMADQMVRVLKKKKITEIWENTAYGQTLHKFTMEGVEKLGGKIIGHETFAAGQDVDFKPILTKFKGMDSDLFYADVTYNDGGLMVNQSRSIGWNVPIFAPPGCNNPKFTEMMPADPGEVYLAVLFNQLSTKPKIVNFVKTFKATYNAEPGEASALAFDTGTVLTTAIELGATERERVAEHEKIEVDGVVYKYKFKENGDNTETEWQMLKMGPGKKWVNYEY